MDDIKLPRDLRIMVIKNMTSEALFNSIAGSLQNDTATEATTAPAVSHQGDPKQIITEREFHALVAKTLFSRSDKVARALQHKLLKSWLKYWSTAKKLSFINSDNDKKEWVELLCAVLKDPLSDYDHKIQCSLLINKLLPHAEDVPSDVIQVILSSVSTHYSVEEQLKLFGSEFSKNDVERLFTVILTQMNVQTSGQQDFDTAYQLSNLSAIAPYSSAPQFAEALEAIKNKLSSKSDAICSYAANAIVYMVPYATKLQRHNLFSVLWGLRNSPADESRGSIHDALVTLLLCKDLPQRDARIHAYLSLFENRNCLMLPSIASGLTQLAVHLSEEQCKLTLCALLKRIKVSVFEDELPYFDIRGIVGAISNGVRFVLNSGSMDSYFDQDSVIVAIGGIAKYLKKESRDELFNALMNTLNDSTLDDEVCAWVIQTFTVVVPHLTNPQRNEVVTLFKNKLRTDEMRCIFRVIKALPSLAPYLSEAQCQELIPLLLPGLNTEYVRLRDEVLSSLGAIAMQPCAKTCLHLLVPHRIRLRWNAKAFAAIAPLLLDNERTELIDYLLNRTRFTRELPLPEIVLVLLPYFSEAQRVKLNRLVIGILETSQYDSERIHVIKIMRALVTKLPSHSRAKSIDAMLAQLNRPFVTSIDFYYYREVRQAVVDLFSTLLPSFSDVQLVRLLNTTGVRTYEKMSLQLMARIQLDLNRCSLLEWDPGKRTGVYFSRVNKAILNLRKFDPTNTTIRDEQPQTFRLWSQDKPELVLKEHAADDCMTEVKSKTGLFHNEI